jgi:hypothetical protein
MSSNVKANSFICHIVARKYGFICFKTLKDLSFFAVEGVIVRKKNSKYNKDADTIFVYKLQCLTKMAWSYLACGI